MTSTDMLVGAFGEQCRIKEGSELGTGVFISIVGPLDISIGVALAVAALEVGRGCVAVAVAQVAVAAAGHVAVIVLLAVLVGGLTD